MELTDEDHDFLRQWAICRRLPPLPRDDGATMHRLWSNGCINISVPESFVEYTLTEAGRALAEKLKAEKT